MRVMSIYAVDAFSGDYVLPLGSYLLNEDGFLHTEYMPYKALENLSKSPVTEEELGSPSVIFARGYGDILHLC
jgi:hypothetical protein